MDEFREKVTRIETRFRDEQTRKRQIWETIKAESPDLVALVKAFGGEILHYEIGGEVLVDKIEAQRQRDRIRRNDARAARLAQQRQECLDEYDGYAWRLPNGD